MAVNRVPVLKRCRSLGMDPMSLGIDKKSNRELKRANRKMSEYALQLREKQKAKFIYGVLEKPFRNYYKKAERMKGQTGENLMTLLECRLDNVVFRLGFARTRMEARQIVDHKHVLVNGKCVNIPSYLVKAGDTIEIKEKVKDSQRYKDILATTGARLVPEWLESNQEALSGVVKEVPARSVIDVPGRYYTYPDDWTDSFYGVRDALSNLLTYGSNGNQVTAKDRAAAKASYAALQQEIMADYADMKAAVAAADTLEAKQAAATNASNAMSQKVYNTTLKMYNKLQAKTAARARVSSLLH